MSSPSQQPAESPPAARGPSAASGTKSGAARGFGASVPRSLVVVLIGVIAACGGGAGRGNGTVDAGPSERSAAIAGAGTAELAAATFVGGDACTECHLQQEQRWRGSDHDLAMQRADADSVLGDFDGAVFTQGGVTARFFRRDAQYWVAAEGPDGETHDYRIGYTFGVEPLQQYLVEFSGGRYQAFDIAWDTRPADVGGQRWFHLRDERYAPGDPLHWTGIGYNWNYMCADCHSTDLHKNFDAASDTYATAYSDVDVSCEACHGPGSLHVEWGEARRAETETRRAGAAEQLPVGGADDAGASAAEMGLQVNFPRIVDRSWIIDPETGLARRDPEGAPAYDVEVCAPCHARRGTIDDDYRFGRPVTDFYRVSMLDEGLYHADGQILDEVFVYGSFLQSRMYQEGVACSDCHEPHGLKPYNGGNALCNRCHLAAKFDTPEHHHHEVGTEGASCVACHMPATTYMVVDPRRDHSFRPPRPDLSIAYGTPNACADCHAQQGDRWLADAVVRWFGAERPASYGELLAAGRQGGPRAEVDLRLLASNDGAPAIMRATALSELPATSQASIGIISAALGSDAAMVRAAAVGALESSDPATVARLIAPLTADPDRSVRLEAARVMATIPPPQIPPADRAPVLAAIDEYRAAQRVSEDRAQAHLNLGWLALQQGDSGVAEREYRTAMRLEPRFVPSFINLADLYRLTGREDQGEQLLRQAAAIAPDNGDALHALGLLLVRQGRLEEAIDTLGRASRRAPDSPHYLYVYAVAVQTAGDTRAAVEILADGLTRFPYDRELLFGAAAYCRELGELDRALAYARRFASLDPDDPQARWILQELEAIRRRP